VDILKQGWHFYDSLSAKSFKPTKSLFVKQYINGKRLNLLRFKNLLKHLKDNIFPCCRSKLDSKTFPGPSHSKCEMDTCHKSQTTLLQSQAIRALLSPSQSFFKQF